MTTLETMERDGALWVTLHRPPLNVMDIGLLRTLHATLLPLRARPDVKVVVLRSGIEGTFSAGADVADHAPDRAPGMLSAFHDVVRLLHTLPQSTLAAVDGRCLGGGCELALVCDVVLATPRATFGQPEIDLGCFPPVAAAWLPRLAPRAAFEMILGGAAVSAAAAAATGLITRVVDDLDAECEAWVARLAGKSAAALALARRALRADGFDAALARAEALYVDALLQTEDAAEGVAAFMEKRRPQWRDR